MMSKYRYPDSISVDRNLVKVNLWIVNELAETNRLKRIEILVKYGGYTSVKRDEMDKELKDRA